MTREALIEVMARAMCVAEFYNPDIIDFDGRENWKGYIRAISAALSAIEAAGVRLVNFAALAEDDAAVERIAEIIRTSVEFGYTDNVINAPEVARAAIRAMGGE